MIRDILSHYEDGEIKLSSVLNRLNVKNMSWSSMTNEEGIIKQFVECHNSGAPRFAILYMVNEQNRFTGQDKLLIHKEWFERV